MSQQFESYLEKLAALDKEELEVARGMLNAYGGAIYEVDLLAIAAMNRSRALSAGFTSLIHSRNLLCAAALLRLQIDTALCFYASSLVNDTGKFTKAVMRGEEIRTMKDRDGKKMTNSYLVSKLSKEYPWLPNVYKKTSGYIHFSGTHVFASVSDVQDDGSFSMQISYNDKHFPDELYIEAISAFNAAKSMLIRFVKDWIFTKSYPEQAAEFLKGILDEQKQREA